MIREGFRLLRLSIHIVKGLWISHTKLRNLKNSFATPTQRLIIQRWLTQVNQIMGLTVRAHGTALAPPALVVANHISWLDIIAIAQHVPVSFLSKAEVKDWPIVGTLAYMAGTLFIDRGGKQASQQAITMIEDHLKNGHYVAIFPEGKTTTGEQIQRFHPRLFAAAVSANVHIQPIAIHYPHPDGINPVAPFVEDISLFKHGWRVLGQKTTTVEIVFCAPITITQQDRKTVANLAQQSIHEIIEAKKIKRLV